MIGTLARWIKGVTHAKIGVLVLIGVVVWLIISSADISNYYSNPSLIQPAISAYGVWAPLVYIVVTILVTIVLIPVAPLTIAGGALFGVYLGTIYSLSGQVVGGVIVYFVLRHLGEEFVHSLLAQKFKPLLKKKEMIEEEGFSAVLLLRLIPLPANVVNLIVGFTKINMKSFTGATIIGSIPGTAIYAYMGDSLVEWDVVGIVFAVVLTLLLCLFAYYFKKIGKINE